MDWTEGELITGFSYIIFLPEGGPSSNRHGKRRPKSIFCACVRVYLQEIHQRSDPQKLLHLYSASLLRCYYI